MLAASTTTIRSIVSLSGVSVTMVKVIILISKVQEEKYTKNSHYEKDGVKSAIKIYSGSEALDFISLVHKVEL